MWTFLDGGTFRQRTVYYCGTLYHMTLFLYRDHMYDINLCVDNLLWGGGGGGLLGDTS